MMLLVDPEKGVVMNPMNISQVSIRPVNDSSSFYSDSNGIEIVFVMCGATTRVFLLLEKIPEKKREAVKRIIENKEEFEKATRRLSTKMAEVLFGEGVMLLDDFIDYIIMGND